MIYEGTIQHIVIDKKGNDKVVKDKYIILNQSQFGEAEDELYKEMGMLTDFDVVALKRSNIKEVVNTRTNNDERIFIVDVKDTFTNEDGEETETIYKVALFAKNVDVAYSRAKDYLKQGFEMELVAVKCTKFADVI